MQFHVAISKSGEVFVANHQKSTQSIPSSLLKKRLKMADTAAAPRGGFGRGRGKRGDDKGGRGGPRRGRREQGEEKWVPVTKLGRLVNEGHIKSIEEVYLFSLPIKVFKSVP